MNCYGVAQSGGDNSLPKLSNTANQINNGVGLEANIVNVSARGISDAAKILKWSTRIGNISSGIAVYGSVLKYRASDRSAGDIADLGVSVTSAVLTTVVKHPVGIGIGVSLGTANEAGAFDSFYNSLDMIQFYNQFR